MAVNNTFYKTFSSCDTIAFMLLPECKPILLGSLTTLSHSIYREKKPVPLLGKINTGGYTRGMRSIAGTMVFTLVNQYLVEDICEQVPYLKEHGKLKADELPMFDIMVVTANEYGAASRMMIYGAEFFEDGQVTSIQDIYIENTFSFVARDIDNFSRIKTIKDFKLQKSNVSLNADTIVPYSFDKQDYDKNYEDTLNNENKDITEVQNKLKEYGINIPVSGVFDTATKDAIKTFQSKNNIPVSGVLDDTTYDLLINGVDSGDVITIINKNGSFVYADEDKTKVIGTAKYQDTFIGTKYGNMAKIKFYGNKGYVDLENTNFMKKKQYEYHNLSEPETGITTTFADFDASSVGTVLKPAEDTETMISAVSYYDGNETESTYRYYKIKAGEEKRLTLSYLPDAYLYNSEKMQLPDMVEFIVSLSDNDDIKWIVKFKK